MTKEQREAIWQLLEVFYPAYTNEYQIGYVDDGDLVDALKAVMQNELSQ